EGNEMVKKEVENYLRREDGGVELDNVVKEYGEGEGVVEGREGKVLDWGRVFDGGYIERGEKEREELVGEE
ncbi:hypothetical protein, partial [Cytobacillus oceanisediminis]|uniref:hypothetical protein n=1 Tax=Cytobacillus oceanisediminis TaxID=665099 RepID=UPI001C93107B